MRTVARPVRHDGLQLRASAERNDAPINAATAGRRPTETTSKED
jgi:hypothetical protein